MPEHLHPDRTMKGTLHPGGASALWGSPWRELAQEHGIGSMDELVTGRGPHGLHEAHLERLDASDISVDEPTCLVLEGHGLCPATLVALATWIDNLIIMGQTQLAVVGTRTTRVALQSDWNLSHWFRASILEYGTIEGLPPLPQAAALAAAGRRASGLIGHHAFAGPTLRILTADTDATGSRVDIVGMPLHDGPSLAARSRARQHQCA